MIGIKPAHGDHESNLMEVGSIPCGFNAMGTGSTLYSQQKYYWCPKDTKKKMLLSNCQFFQYFNRNIGLFSIALLKAINRYYWVSAYFASFISSNYCDSISCRSLLLLE